MGMYRNESGDVVESCHFPDESEVALLCKANSLRLARKNALGDSLLSALRQW